MKSKSAGYYSEMDLALRELVENTSGPRENVIQQMMQTYPDACRREDAERIYDEVKENGIENEKVAAEVELDECPDCHGSGMGQMSQGAPVGGACPKCKGMGMIEKPVGSGFMVGKEEEACEAQLSDTLFSEGSFTPGGQFKNE